ncbi:hypothetical protein [Corynebacterium hindlerae]|nr:hypothetical protein [Corynebacterium hindlerae]
MRKGFKVRVLTELVAPMNKEYAELALQEMEDAGATLV